MAALDGNSILGKVIDQQLSGQAIITTMFLFSELPSSQADAFIFKLEINRFLQTNQFLIGYPQ